MPEPNHYPGHAVRAVSSRPLRIAIVNDYEVVVAGVRAMLSPHSQEIDVVELDVDQNPDHVVDIALFDTYGQPQLGLHRVRSLAQSQRVGSVAIYTWSLTAGAREAAYHAGARALIAKTLSAPELVASLRAVAGGEIVDTGGFRGASLGPWPGSRWDLSARESEVLALVTTGMTNKAVAEALYVSENTVRTHLKSIFRKLDVSNRSQAVARALSDGSFTTREAPPWLARPTAAADGY
jgi:NarL family two-component system response regulator LiaR